MRLAPLLILVVACSIAPAETPTTSTSPAPISTGDLGEVTIRSIAVDDTELVVAVAATAEERSQGLRGVDDLGDLDGMLFSWGGEEVTSRFTMADTLIELDIAFFDVDGVLVDAFRMTPCDGEDCPSYAASGPYAYALETPAGQGPTVGAGSVLDPGQ